MKSIEEEYPDYDWEKDYDPLRDSCKILQILGIIAIIGSFIGAFLLVASIGSVIAFLLALQGIILGLMIYAIAGGLIVLADIARDVNYASNIAMIMEEKSRTES